MDKKKGIGFIAASALKLLAYLLICGAVEFAGSRLAEDGIGRFVPSAAAVVITWLFLTYIEGGRRSFFAKGYILENIFCGGIAGLLGFVVPFAAEWIVTGRVSINGINNAFDIREPLYDVFSQSLFAGIVIFGYFFHIIKQDFGNIPAVVLSAVLYAVYSIYGNAASGYGAYGGGTDRVWYIAAAVLTGIGAGFCIINFGDMRSACSFLCLMRFAESLSAGLLNVSYNGDKAVYYDYMFASELFSIALAAVCIWLFISIVKKD